MWNKYLLKPLLQNIQNCSYNNIVAYSNFKVDKVSFENLNSPYQKTKMISNKSNQVDEDDNQNNNDNPVEQFMILAKRINKSNPTTVGDKVTEKETNKQIIESSCHH